MNAPQFRGALITNQAEAHSSLGALYIDVSLVKYQPLNEYREVGRCLSARRRQEADEGQSHATAEKLGLLFDSLVPDTPDLLKAYGLRCSEIAQSETHNPQGNSRYGLFANEVGADGTTIWAAATSGTSSIAIHLLACMLSRMWDTPEAVSIWMELITDRKNFLSQSGKRMDFAASRVELTREEISNWHASAHAWRLTADQANEPKQRQLLLIIDNLGIPVSGRTRLGDSVIDTWITAMITVDKLVRGEAQSIQIGAPLLGLASWHLYPDMIVFGRGRDVTEVKLKDSLIQ
ncbi:hypothetical protein BDV96DRAFT_651797 [Lophiotrema nucula]|uniref:Uncharacterized protein n=1 Tax=Lophiotrema nucula TaxID=690887 RepID=A0A6A5YQS0_9PLEO|nr:hypothetical protein BDV96DRAFT_651797 [Lophiotrema nucula]